MWHAVGILTLSLIAWAVIIVIRVSFASPGRAVDYPQESIDLVSSVQPATGEDAWPLLMTASARIEEICSKHAETHKNGRPWIDFASLCSRSTDKDAARRHDEELAQQALLEVFGGDMPQLLDRIVQAPRCIRPKPTGLILSQDLQLILLRDLVRCNRVRMRQFGERREEPEFLRAIEWNLAIARHISRQPLALDRLVAIATVSNTFEELVEQTLERELPESTLRAALTLFDALNMPPASHMFKGERIMALDAIQASYSDDGHGSGVRLLNSNAPTRAGIINVVGLFLPRKKTVVSTAEKLYCDMQTLADTERSKRPSLGLDPIGDLTRLGDRYELLQLLMPGFDKLVYSGDTFAANLGGAKIVLAIELYRRTHNNTPPPALTDLVPTALSVLPTDPFAPDGRFRYHVLQQPDASARTYLVYTVASDGVDNGGTPSRKNRYNAFSRADPGSDFIINETRRDER